MFEGFAVEVIPDADAFIRLVTGGGSPKRVHFVELFLDLTVEAAIARRFRLDEGLDPSAPFYELARRTRVLEFLGYDFVYEYHLDGLTFPRELVGYTDDTAPAEVSMGRRGWVNEQKGPVTTWREFEEYPWPEPGKLDTRPLEWLEANLPDGMCMTSRAHCIFEELSWLMGLETLGLALYDDPELVSAVAEKVGEVFLAAAGVLVQFERMRFLFGGDDMGFKTATLISPEALRKYVLPWHKRIAAVAHEAGRPYFLHSCGNLEEIMGDLVDDVGIDARHSFEDAIEPVESVFKRWGERCAIFGGVDMDFLCRSTPEEVRRRTREILDACLPGRYCLGTGNSVANYVPLENYLAMLDEGRRYSG